jgi:potassium efflux system protein
MRVLLLTSLLISLLATGLLSAQVAAGGDAWDATQLDAAALRQALAETGKAIAALPKSEKEGDPEPPEKAVLDRRKALLEELIAVLPRQAEAGGRTQEATPAAVQAIKDRIKELEAREAPAPPEKPSLPEFDRLKKELEAWRDRLAKKEKELKALNEVATGVASRRVAAEKRLGEAEAAAKQLADELSKATDDAARETLRQRLRNRRLETRLETERLALIQAEETMAGAVTPMLTLSIDLGKRTTARLEREFGLYQEALKHLFEDKKKALERKLAEQEKELAEAKDPDEKFLAEKRLEIVQNRIAVADLEKRKTELAQLETKWNQLKDYDEKKLTSVLELIDRSTDSNLISRRLSAANRDILHRREELRDTNASGILVEYERYLDQELKAGDRSLKFDQKWDDRVEEITASMGDYDRWFFRSEAAELKTRLRDYREKRLRPVLRELMNRTQSLVTLLRQHATFLDEKETEIQAHFIWYSDQPPFDLDLFRRAGKEAERLFTWLDGFLNDPHEQKTDGRTIRERIVMAVVFLLLLPALLFEILRRTRRYVRNRLEGPKEALRKLPVTLFSVVAAVLVPAYLMVLAAILERYAVFPVVHTVIAAALELLAYALLVVGMARTFCGARGLAPALFGMKEDTARTILRVVVMLLIADVFFLIPWAMLRADPPFGFVDLPRIAYTAFEIVALTAIVMLIHKRSPLMRDVIGPDPAHKLTRFWSLVSFLTIVLSLTIVALDLIGNRYLAKHMSRSLLLSLGTLFLLVALYRIAVPFVDEVLRKRREKLTSAPGESPKVTAWEFGQQVRSLLRLLFGIAVIFVFARYWGLDERAFRTLDKIHLITIAAADKPPITVTLGDVVSCVLSLIITFWLIRFLPSIYEITLFHRFRWDPGLRYAVLSISRYCLVFIGILLALHFLKLDLSRLGWLVAALGVGIGFGLQEIVSNFISGIILLVERPIRVGDWVTIGKVTGVVKRINIRATTVQNWDRLEVVLPNKDLITKEVTNWTLADPVTRITVPIGVAYGSDVDEVKELLLRLVKEQPEVLKDPGPSVIFMKHGESSLDFEVRFFLGQTSLRLEMIDRMNRLINKMLKEKGIRIPFPQRDLHVHPTTPDHEQRLPEPEPERGEAGAGSEGEEERQSQRAQREDAENAEK